VTSARLSTPAFAKILEEDQISACEALNREISNLSLAISAAHCTY